MNKYDWITDEMFYGELENQVNEYLKDSPNHAVALMNLDSILTALKDEFRNDVIKALEIKRNGEIDEEKEKMYNTGASKKEILKYHCNYCRKRPISVHTCAKVDTIGVCHECYDLLTKNEELKFNWLNEMFNIK